MFAVMLDTKSTWYLAPLSCFFPNEYRKHSCDTVSAGLMTYKWASLTQEEWSPGCKLSWITFTRTWGPRRMKSSIQSVMDFPPLNEAFGMFFYYFKFHMTEGGGVCWKLTRPISPAWLAQMHAGTFEWNSITARDPLSLLLRFFEFRSMVDDSQSGSSLAIPNHHSHYKVSDWKHQTKH